MKIILVTGGLGFIGSNNKISNNFLDNNSNSFDLVEYVKDRPVHDIRYSIDSSKLQKLGWKTINSFDESLEKTIKWYFDNPNWLN